MVIVKVMAGLGNQMFQYASARAIAIQKNTDLYLDTKSYSNIAPGDTLRKYELSVYNIKASIATDNLLDSVLPQNSVRPRYIERVKEFFGQGRIWTFLESHHGYNSAILEQPKNVYLSGWWQSPKYFTSIRSTLLEELEPANPPNAMNGRYITKAQTLNSVSLHVRRGDYVSNDNATKHHGLTPVAYYTKAIEYFSKEVPSPTFFVFSDDLTWCKENLPLNKVNCEFISGNDGDMAYEDIRIMKNCKHSIIANSSFSWWGAWLNENPKKIVIAPKIWVQDTKQNNELDIIPEEWIRL